MMSDHWKAIARLLGAPGAAEPAAKTESKEAISGPAPALESEKKVAPPAENVVKPVAREIPSDRGAKVGSRPEPKKQKVELSGFGSGLLSDDVDSGESVSSSEPSSLAGAKVGGDVVSSEPDLLDFRSFKTLDDEKEATAKAFFNSNDGRTPESSVPESRGRKPAGEPTAAKEPVGLDKIFGDSDEGGELSSWDLLVDRLGVPVPKEERGNSVVSESPNSASPKSGAADFGVGSGRGRSARKPASSEKKAEAPRTGFAEGLSADRGLGEAEVVGGGSSGLVNSGETPAEVDPLAELGEFGWGPPRRQRSGGRSDQPARPSVEEAKSTDTGRVGGTRDVPRSRSEERPASEDRSERRPARGDSPRRGDSASGDSGTAATRKSPVDETGSSDDSARGSRRGRRRGQRQRMSEESSDLTAEKFGRESEDDFASDIFDGAQLDDGVSSEADDDAVAGADEPVRRRRRRGRRRRGVAAEGQEDAGEVKPVSQAEPDGRAIEAEFDDDHEDDDEAVVLRRSRRRRRRRSPDAEPKAAGYDGELDSSDVEGVAYDAMTEGDEDDDVSTFVVQGNVPTWLNAVDLLVNANMDSRKRDPKRSSGNSGGGNRQRPRR